MQYTFQSDEADLVTNRLLRTLIFDMNRIRSHVRIRVRPGENLSFVLPPQMEIYKLNRKLGQISLDD